MKSFLTKKNFKEKVNIYLCGPTVYDEIHIGNIRPSLLIDVIIKSLLKKKIPFKYVQNITDIDDKIITKAQEENRTEKEISEFYKTAYFQNLKKLKIINPETHCVTDNIGEITNFIEKIIKKKHAYVLEKNVIFDTKKWKNYGKLSGQNIKKLLEKVRDTNKYPKKNEADFTLWRETEKGIKWKNPWIKDGRPGWHTECSAIINKVFKAKTIEIHAGGKDLIFPHHENERIQYLSVNNREICKKWIHFGHVILEKEKMSKSLGNIITVKDYLNTHGVNSLKILIFNSKYNDDIEVSNSKIEQSNAISKKLFNLNKKIRLFLFVNKIILDKGFKEEEYFDLVFNNLETSKLVFEIEKKISQLNKLVSNVFNCNKKSETLLLIESLYFICDLLGISIKKRDYKKKEREKIEKWIFFLKSNKFKESDKLREELQKKLII